MKPHTNKGIVVCFSFDLTFRANVPERAWSPLQAVRSLPIPMLAFDGEGIQAEHCCHRGDGS